MTPLDVDILGMNSKCVFVPSNDVQATLAVPATAGKKLLQPFRAFALANNLPFNILEDVNVVNEAEVHIHEGDLWLCLEGEVAFVYGGEMVNPWFKKLADGTEDRREVKAKEIKGGTTSILKPGDWLWIPAGQPHQHNCTGTARLMIIKIPAA